jgi:diacylglycerol kinase (ATP)
VLGGDGTWSKVAAAIAGAGGDCRLAFLAAGTGNDFVKSLDLPASDYAAMASLTMQGGERRIDVGRVDDHIFLNVAGFGFDAAAAVRIARTPFLRGASVYYYAAIRELFGYQGISVRVPDERGAGGFQTILTMAFANGRSYGGNFEIAPGARVDDGMLDVITIGEAGPLRRLALFAAATRGAHVAQPEVRQIRAPSATLEFRAPMHYQADGELRLTRSGCVEIAILPAALRVVSRA